MLATFVGSCFTDSKRKLFLFFIALIFIVCFSLTIPTTLSYIPKTKSKLSSTQGHGWVQKTRQEHGQPLQPSLPSTPPIAMPTEKQKHRKSYSVCGTADSFDYLQHGRTCFNKTKEEMLKSKNIKLAHLKLTACPWPKSSILQSLSPRADSDLTTVYPIPGSPHFQNFSISEARDLLKGKTIVIAGDSTSRRLFWTLCNWLAQGSTTSRTDPFLIDKLGGYRAIYCNETVVTQELDILLVYQGSIKFDGTLNLLRLVKTYPSTRDNQELKSRTKILAVNMPRKHTKSVHIFEPAISYHMLSPCALPAEELLNKSVSNKCEFELFFDDEMFKTLATMKGNTAVACAVTAEMCHRFMERFDQLSFKETDPPIFAHVMSNVPVQPGKLPFKTVSDYFSLEIAQAAYAYQLDLPRCDKFKHLLEHDKYFPAFKGLGFCDFVDQSTWMLNGAHWTRDFQYGSATSEGPETDTFEPEISSATGNAVRHKCFGGDGYQGIHVMAEQGQLMRMQNILNVIYQSERKLIPRRV